jgi:hypothetical protein
VSRPALGPTQPPVQWVPGVLSPRPGRDADHSPSSSAEVKNEYELYFSPPSATMACSGTALQKNVTTYLFLQCFSLISHHKAVMNLRTTTGILWRNAPERLSGSSLSERSRTFPPGIYITNTSPCRTEFWVNVRSGTHFFLEK